MISVARSADLGPAAYAGVQPTGNRSTLEVTIPPLPAGHELVNVYIFNDCNGTKPKPLGAVSSVKFKDACDSTNFIWRDTVTKIMQWQLVTPNTKTGSDLLSIFHPEGYKYGFTEADVNRK